MKTLRLNTLPILPILPFLSISALAGCAATAPDLIPPSLPPVIAAPLQVDHFQGDESYRVSDVALREILAAPVALEEHARIGVVPVTDAYAPDGEAPLAPALAALERALENTATFDVVTEVSTGWPAASGLAGLRELAARYRTEYLLLYRQRFVQDSNVNAWAILYPTVVAALFVPANTLRTAGVLEATLFEVKSGTIMFTAFERVSGRSEENVWQNDRKLRALEASLVSDAAELLAKEVEAQIGRLKRSSTTTAANDGETKSEKAEEP